MTNEISSVARMQIVMMEKSVWTTSGSLTKMEMDTSAGKPVISLGLQLCALMVKKSSTSSIQITMALMEATVSHGPVQQNKQRQKVLLLPFQLVLLQF